MVAQKGKDLLLKIDNAGSFVTVAGLRARRIAFNSETVDITDSDSAGRWRELLAGSGVQRAAISGSGIFKDAASDALIRQRFFAGEIVDWQFAVPDFGTVEGPFQITSLEYTGSHDGEVTFEVALEFGGPDQLRGGGMTANRRRGEIEAELDGKAYRLCLTLGALAELEAAYAADDLGALVERFSSGRLSAIDMIRVIGAGLRGAGTRFPTRRWGPCARTRARQTLPLLSANF